MMDYYGDALAIYRELGDEKGIADGLQNLAFANMTSSQGAPDGMETSARLFEESLARYQAFDDKRNIASVVGALGYTRMMTGHPAEARAAIEQAIELNQALGFAARENDGRLALGHIARITGEYDEAIRHYRTALLQAVEMADASRKLMHLTPVASLLAATRHYEEAVRLVGAVERGRDEQGGTLSFGPVGITDPLLEVRSGGIAEAQIEAWLAEGRQIDLDSAVEYALAALDSEARPG